MVKRHSYFNRLTELFEYLRTTTFRRSGNVIVFVVVVSIVNLVDDDKGESKQLGSDSRF